MVKLRSLVALSAYSLVGSLVLSTASVVIAERIAKQNVPKVEAEFFAATLDSAPDQLQPISLVFVGDVMLDRTVLTRINKAKDDYYSFRKVMPDERFTKADFQVMNLEGPVTTKRRPPVKDIDFAFEPRFIDILKQVGFDAASQANNHSQDQGSEGASESRELLKKSGLTVFGDEISEGDVALAIVKIKDRTVALVGFNSASNPLDKVQAQKTLARARQSANTVIAYLHWGEEYRHRPTQTQENQARWLIDNGVDIVIGAHPHWVQGIRLYKGRPIIYSLGNFVFDQDWSEETKHGLTVKLLVSDREYVIELHPVYIDKSQPRFLDGASKSEHLRLISSYSDASLTHQILQGRIAIPVHGP